MRRTFRIQVSGCLIGQLLQSFTLVAEETGDWYVTFGREDSLSVIVIISSHPMNTTPTLTCLLLLIIGLSSTTQAQETNLTPAFKEQTVGRLSQQMNEHYVFPEVAKKTGTHLKTGLKAGQFDKFDKLETFAEALTTEIRSVSKDKHLLVRLERPREEKLSSMAQMFKDHKFRMDYQRNDSGGFREAKKLEGNVGYFDLRSFARPNIGRPFADSFMQLLSSSDAIIIDLRSNGGGSPAMVQYLCSYFFDKKVHLNSLYFREGDRTEEYWTLDTVNGQRLPDVPLFVLTSDQTFSGAEEFSYNMQTQKRATLVGQTTRGGANPGTLFPLNEKLEAFIPTGRAINPVTNTNWEGVGVVPEVKTTLEEAFDTVYELAKTAALEYRQREDEKAEKLFADLLESIESFDASSGEATVLERVKACTEADLLEEWQINMIGYEYLNRYEKPKVAEAFFRANVLLFPGSANAYDSYGEALGVNGKMKKSLENYRKAMEVARAGNAPDVKMFEENLRKAEGRM